MKTTVLGAIEMKGDEMAAAGYFEGVLAARWAEIMVEQSQDDVAWGVYWRLRENLGADKD